VPDILPATPTPDAFDALAKDDARIVAAARLVANRHRLAGAPIARFAGGSLPVFALGPSRVLKFYPPCFPGEAEVELAVLQALEGKLPTPTPRVDADGGIDGWRWILMERLRGELLSDVWPRLSEAERHRLASPIGEALAALHRVPVPPLVSQRATWSDFVTGQLRGCCDRPRRFGLAAGWLEQIPGFLERAPLRASASVLLHTEVMREHFYVERRGDAWIPSGLFDFEPAMEGDPEYEFASVGVFLSGGDARFLGALIRAYGYQEVDGAQRRRFLAYTLLHRYSRLAWYLERVPPGPGVTTPDALADAWWRAT
jgi:hygromycin-B 7''-O-kinase